MSIKLCFILYHSYAKDDMAAVWSTLSTLSAGLLLVYKHHVILSFGKCYFYIFYLFLLCCLDWDLKCNLMSGRKTWSTIFFLNLSKNFLILKVKNLKTQTHTPPPYCHFCRCCLLIFLLVVLNITWVYGQVTLFHFLFHILP